MDISGGGAGRGVGGGFAGSVPIQLEILRTPLPAVTNTDRRIRDTSHDCMELRGLHSILKSLLLQALLILGWLEMEGSEPG